MAAKSKQEIMDNATNARKKGVDAANKKAFAKEQKEIEALANTPLTAEERAFCGRVASKMNNGRTVDKPQAAEILRYSKLRPRLDIKAEAEGESV